VHRPAHQSSNYRHYYAYFCTDGSRMPSLNYLIRWYVDLCRLRDIKYIMLTNRDSGKYSTHAVVTYQQGEWFPQSIHDANQYDRQIPSCQKLHVCPGLNIFSLVFNMFLPTIMCAFRHPVRILCSLGSWRTRSNTTSGNNQIKHRFILL
jgi:hypothetical protein